VRTPILTFTALCLTALASPESMAIEEPPYRVVERDGSYELRDYSAYLLAETRVEAPFLDAGNLAFNRLFRYISGNNAARQDIAMTAPVTQAPANRARGGGEKIAMTAPVNQVADGEAFLVGFVVPAKYTRDTVPQPLDPAVKIREVPAQLTASWRYSGRWTETNFEAALAELRAVLKARGLVPAGDPVIARYNPPRRAATKTTPPAADVAEAGARANRLQAELSAKLQAAIGAGGPVAAIAVCKLEAPAIAARLSGDGWQVRRVGTRVRNPASGRPDAWEQAALEQFARRLRAGEPAEGLSVAAVVEDAGGATRLRWMRPIMTGALCVTCHGAVESQSPGLRAALRREYPQDAAVGYAPGELRGAFSVSRTYAAAR
jgi:SOUL heme-binding protein/Protein of unknown function (DUF3365)